MTKLVTAVMFSHRLDQTLGKPSSWMVGTEKDKQKMTIMARLARVETQVNYVQYRSLTLHLIFGRLDQTLGKPGAWLVGNEKDKQRATVVARLTRVEDKVHSRAHMISHMIHRHSGHMTSCHVIT